MTDWLLANPQAGGDERNEGFWREHLAKVGLDGVRGCDLDRLDWVREVMPGDRILVAGGDGSVNRAAGLCLETGATLAVLPSGTANDFFRNLGIDNDPEAICQALVEYSPHPVDVAALDGGLCLNVVHIGLGTMPARDASANGDAKKRLGQLSYLFSLARRVFSRRGFRATITTDTATVAGRWLSIAIANGGYFGGGSKVPGASLTNGELVVIAVRPASVLTLMSAFITTRFLGRTPKDEKTVVKLTWPHCRVTTRHVKTVTVDGDVAGKTPVAVTCRPGSLKVIGAFGENA
ncbi:diacylglycerol/lipid kinase family protein [Marinobacter zhanjiangensis]|uniref:Lipid kinase YegS-like protein n=1 Tax=Marinobacter zhanjiangensis TaxID=578215 RepID=A0ABQ3B2Q9_9GAMM|nr:diacylglycerol kinase family protein [Marinobacter zhanjiangensis]GGY75145.1 putative lipid kinase YegS-like protein [Marinobacter zhanjiangensis]